MQFIFNIYYIYMPVIPLFKNIISWNFLGMTDLYGCEYDCFVICETDDRK